MRYIKRSNIKKLLKHRVKPDFYTALDRYVESLIIKINSLPQKTIDANVLPLLNNSVKFSQLAISNPTQEQVSTDLHFSPPSTTKPDTCPCGKNINRKDAVLIFDPTLKQSYRKDQKGLCYSCYLAKYKVEARKEA